MTTPAVAAQSKPELQKALRDTWRKDSVHVVEQFQRFFRLAIAAAMPSLIDLINGGKFDKKTLIAFVIPFLEVAYRQMFPALGAKAVDEAQGATIVPEQVGVVTDPVPAPDPVEPPVEQDVPDPLDTEGGEGLDTAPTGDISADGTPAPPDYVPGPGEQ